MANSSMKLFFNRFDYSLSSLRKQELCQGFLYNILIRCQSQWSKVGSGKNDDSTEGKDASRNTRNPKMNEQINFDSGLAKYSSDEDDLSDNNKWKLELDWLTKALEPALQLYKWALPTGNGNEQKFPPATRSVSEIIASIQRSKAGIQDWGLSDLTIGLYLVYLRQASANQVEDVHGIPISSDAIVQDLIYYTELAKGCYKDSTTGLARNSMLRERNIVKFVKDSSVLRPGYYIGIDIRSKLVIFGIRGTHTVSDLITNIASTSDQELTFEGYSTHFGTAEAARWFLHHELGTLRTCLKKHEGFRLRLVGHSLGGAAAALLAIMLRNMSSEELGFSPDIVSAIGIATPPCVSKELAESCSSYVSTLVLQDDIVPRLSVAALVRLRNEILQTDWMSILEKEEEWKRVVDLVSNAKQVVSSVQDVARKFADYAKFTGKTNASDVSMRKKSIAVAEVPRCSSKTLVDSAADRASMPEELFVPGLVYYLKREVDADHGSISSKGRESYTLWKRHPGEHFQRIVLSSNLISDHKCESHYYALRDVLKSLPVSNLEHSDGLDIL
ncbi:diacylglycerol lipase-beta isoform X2 [Telopea speciosissima]|uniref:diacylglycerol lipase-beta isoform X1 n=1 Tax=Telopea speciosissima TaxID=54955 RepID=UPI001CC6BCF2|nr:diacylglycerol lipase-beta isoform X1 [Telopea speciosissima]XP_043693788.1 diacylglycerol lipase-beta isoform X2 [Telopea speciosissima]